MLHSHQFIQDKPCTQSFPDRTDKEWLVNLQPEWQIPNKIAGTSMSGLEIQYVLSFSVFSYKKWCILMPMVRHLLRNLELCMRNKMRLWVFSGVLRYASESQKSLHFQLHVACGIRIVKLLIYS